MNTFQQLMQKHLKVPESRRTSKITKMVQNNSFLQKKARGMMVRYIIDTKCRNHR
jgi:cytoplasmic iron level regulating protein YaaA (DUF328/UPF0246 family)